MSNSELGAGYNIPFRPCNWRRTLHQHDGVVLDRQAGRAVWTSSRRSPSAPIAQQHAAQVHEVNAQIEQRPATGRSSGLSPTPLSAGNNDDHAADEFERQVLDSPRPLRVPGWCPMMGQYRKHNGTAANTPASCGGVGQCHWASAACEGAGFLDARTGMRLSIKEPRRIGHVAMPAKHEGKIRLQRRAHIAIVLNHRTLSRVLPMEPPLASGSLTPTIAHPASHAPVSE